MSEKEEAEEDKERLERQVETLKKDLDKHKNILPPTSSRGKENNFTKILKKANEKKMMDSSTTQGLNLRSLSKTYSNNNLIADDVSSGRSPRDDFSESDPKKHRFNFRSKSPMAQDRDNYSTADKTDTSEN